MRLRSEIVTPIVSVILVIGAIVWFVAANWDEKSRLFPGDLDEVIESNAIFCLNQTPSGQCEWIEFRDSNERGSEFSYIVQIVEGRIQGYSQRHRYIEGRRCRSLRRYLTIGNDILDLGLPVREIFHIGADTERYYLRGANNATFFDDEGLETANGSLYDLNLPQYCSEYDLAEPGAGYDLVHFGFSGSEQFSEQNNVTLLPADTSYVDLVR
tara:strand:- start:116 stop:751 length:636 start_codon:yes stop_codon:yes gene_type:complete